MKYGQMIYEARKRLGLTQKDVARILDVSNGYISDIEGGRRAPPSFGRSRQIAKLLHIQLSELVHAAAVEHGYYKVPAAGTERYRDLLRQTIDELCDSVAEEKR